MNQQVDLIKLMFKLCEAIYLPLPLKYLAN